LIVSLGELYLSLKKFSESWHAHAVCSLIVVIQRLGASVMNGFTAERMP